MLLPTGVPHGGNGILTRGNGQQRDTVGEEETQWIGEKHNKLLHQFYSKDNRVPPASLFGTISLLFLSYSSEINGYLYSERVSPPLKKTP